MTSAAAAWPTAAATVTDFNLTGVMSAPRVQHDSFPGPPPQNAGDALEASNWSVGRSSLSIAWLLPASAALEQEPDPPFCLIDPWFDQARRGNVSTFVAELMALAHAGDQLHVVVAQLGQHILRRHVVGVVVEHPLQAGDMSDGPYGGPANLPDALRDSVRRGEELRGLRVHHQVVLAEMRARDVPVKVLHLQIQRQHVSEQGGQGRGY